MKLFYKIALGWALLSIVGLLIIGLVPTTAQGVDCGALFGTQPVNFLADTTACTDQRSWLRMPAIAAGANAVIALVAAFFAYSELTNPVPTPREAQAG